MSRPLPPCNSTSTIGEYVARTCLAPRSAWISYPSISILMIAGTTPRCAQNASIVVTETSTGPGRSRQVGNKVRIVLCVFVRIFPKTFSAPCNLQLRAQHVQDSRFRGLERSGANVERAGIEKAAISICIQGHDFQSWMQP